MNDAQVEEATVKFEAAFKELAAKKGFDRFLDKVKPLILSAGSHGITDTDLMDLIKTVVGKVTGAEVTIYAKKLAEYREKWGVTRKTKARKTKAEDALNEPPSDGLAEDIG